MEKGSYRQVERGKEEKGEREELEILSPAFSWNTSLHLHLIHLTQFPSTETRSNRPSHTLTCPDRCFFAFQHPPGYMVPPWMTASRFLAGNTEAELNPTSFSSLLFLRDFIFFLFSSQPASRVILLVGFQPGDFLQFSCREQGDLTKTYHHLFTFCLSSSPAPPFPPQRYSALSAACSGYSLIIIIIYKLNNKHTNNPI